MYNPYRPPYPNELYHHGIKGQQCLDGVTLTETTMIVTPAAVEEYFNVSRAAMVSVWRNCCQTLTVRNTSDIPILMQSANIIFSRPDLAVTY